MTNVPNVFLRRAVLLGALALAGCGSMMSPSGSGGMGGATQLNAVLTGSAEVPPAATNGAGTFTATLDRSSNILRWTLVHSGLTGPATAAHLHGPALPGANAGVVVPFQNPASGSQGQATLTAAQVADLMAGKWYANVHTAAYPGGEIRGQVMAR